MAELKSKQKSKNLDRIIPLCLFTLGIIVLLYPSVSSWYNSVHQSQVINSYTEQIKQITPKEKNDLLESARLYNGKLSELDFPFSDHSSLERKYNEALNFDGNGIMGHISIDTIHVDLPICHGTAETTLDRSAGHLEGSSLPIGGIGTHSVITAHRGLPSARLFTDIDKLKEGDIFKVSVLDETLCYEVDQIRTVQPNELEYLAIENDKDLCTLMTCTPYGINTDRLLVRGHRIQEKEIKEIPGDATQTDSLVLAPFVALPILLIFMIAYMTSERKSKNRSSETHEERLLYLESELKILAANYTPAKKANSVVWRERSKNKTHIKADTKKKWEISFLSDEEEKIWNDIQRLKERFSENNQ